MDISGKVGRYLTPSGKHIHVNMTTAQSWVFSRFVDQVTRYMLCVSIGGRRTEEGGRRKEEGERRTEEEGRRVKAGGLMMDVRMDVR